MDIANINNLKSLFAEHSIKPNKLLGQNFLVSRKILDQMIELANIKKMDRILEVGGGAGTLTKELAKYAKDITVIEKDPNLIPILETALKEFKNIEIIKADVLKLKELPYAHEAGKWRVIANIPYWITGRFLRIILEGAANPPNEIILMVQKELAERICAKPPKMNLLSVSVQYYGKPEIIIKNISPEDFWPPSGVNSTVIKIKVTKNKKSAPETERFFRIVHAGFTHPRKQLRANLKKVLGLRNETINKILKRCDLENTVRAQELSIKKWECLKKEIMV